MWINTPKETHIYPTPIRAPNLHTQNALGGCFSCSPNAPFLTKRATKSTKEKASPNPYEVEPGGAHGKEGEEEESATGSEPLLQEGEHERH